MMTTENAIGEAIVAYLKRRKDRQASIREIIEHLPAHVELTREDKQASDTRPGEAMWEQRVRNLRCHRNTLDGKLLHVQGGFRLGKAAQTSRAKRHERAEGGEHAALR